MSVIGKMGRAACVAAAIALGGAGAVTATAPRADAAEITVTHWGVLMYGAPYAVAMEKGYFKDAGIDVTGVLTSKGGGTTMRNVMAASLPYGEVALSAVVAAINQGADLKIVHTGVQTVGEILWVTLPDSPIKTTKDLDGQKVAFTSPKSVTEMLLTMVSDKNGIKPEMIAAGGVGAGLTLLKEGAVVAAPIMDPIWARLSDNYRPVFQVADELPQITQSVGVTTSDFLKKNPDTIRALIEGRRKGVDFVYANPEEAAQIVGKYYEMDPALALKAINNLIALEYWSRGELDFAAMDNLIDGLRIIGEVEGNIDWPKYVDASFVN